MKTPNAVGSRGTKFVAETASCCPRLEQKLQSTCTKLNGHQLLQIRACWHLVSPCGDSPKA
eukprot:2639665-Alexandrium_andersonii.AAC.1